MQKKQSWLTEICKDKNFLKIIHITENLVSKILSSALIIVIFVSIFDLIIVLWNDLFSREPNGFFNITLIEIFGFFLNILIALELLENITVYLKKHVVQLELVLTTALIAIARKIIIFDTSKFDKIDLMALGFATLCLAGGYWLVHYTHHYRRK